MRPQNGLQLMSEEIWNEKIFKDDASYFFRITKKRRRSETLHLPKQKHVSVISTDQTLGTTHAAARFEAYFTEISERRFGQQNGKVGGSELGIALRF